jgi:hypothetical protein
MLIERERPSTADLLFEVKYFSIQGIRCQFLPPSGSMGPSYVLQLLLSEKPQNYLLLSKHRS